MAEDVISSDRNGSFQNPPDEFPTSSRSKRHASKAASSAWTELKNYCMQDVCFSQPKLISCISHKGCLLYGQTQSHVPRDFVTFAVGFIYCDDNVVLPGKPKSALLT